MRDRISAFLEEKQGLSVNSKQSYKYDLEQFLDMVGERISETSLKIYQAQLANLKISAQKRKISACNQFLYFLYQKGEVDSFYRLELAMIGRLFAQDAALYADIIIDKPENLDVIESLKQTYEEALQFFEKGDRQGFIDAFHQVREWFGEYSDQFLQESRQLLQQAHDLRHV